MKRVLIIFILLVVLILSGSVIFLWVGLEPAINRFKPVIETRISHLIKKETRIDGRIQLSLYPHIKITAHDLKIKTAKKPFFSAKTLVIICENWPLQKGTLSISAISAGGPRLHIQPGLKETYRVPPKKPVPFYTKYVTSLVFVVLNGISGQPLLGKGPPLKAIKIGQVSLEQGDFSIVNKKRKRIVALEGIQLTLDGLHLKDFADLKKGWRHLLKALPFTGKASAKDVHLPKLNLSNLQFQAHNQAGRLRFSQVKAKPITGSASGLILVDTQNPQMGYQINLELSALKLPPLLRLFKSKMKATGRLDVEIKVTSQGKSVKSLLKTLNGQLDLKGNNLTFSNLDIDAILENYEKSQAMDLFDLTAVVLFGPLGFVATKSFDASNIVLQGTGKGKSAIPNLRFDWKIKQGIAESVDVAFATLKHRVAAKGKLDLKKLEYNEVKIALLNKKGCIEYSQTINGPLKKPEVNSMSYVGKVLVSPITTLAKKVKGLFTDKCDLFYEGAVLHPKL